MKLNYTHFLHSGDYGSVCLNIFECFDMYVAVYVHAYKDQGSHHSHP